MIDFDKQINRENTCSLKWDNRIEIFGSKDVFPMWLADMDFEAPNCIVEAIKKRAEHGIYGYSMHSDEFYNAFISWTKTKQNWEVEKDWCFFSPGIVPALAIAVKAFSNIGDKIIVQKPVYNPFFTVIEGNKRELVNCPLNIENGQFGIDFHALEKEFAAGAKMMFVCNPHNPGGRVWTREELTRIGDLAIKYNVIIISDEIHGDLVFDEYMHIPFASLGEKYQEISIVCQAPSKTFNIAGLSSSIIIIPNEELRSKMKGMMETLHLCSGNIFGTEAFKTAYSSCGEWHTELMKYLKANRDITCEFFKNELHEIPIISPQASFLAWVDFRVLNLNDADLNRFLVEKAGVGLSPGVMYGQEGSGFMRLNFGLNKAQLIEKLEKIKVAIKQKIG